MDFIFLEKLVQNARKKIDSEEHPQNRKREK